MMRPWDQARIKRAADFIWLGHLERRAFENLPQDLAPETIDQAYDVQEIVQSYMAERVGPIAGSKIATTTKVMQQVMGIDHPCGGAIFASRIFKSPAEINLTDYLHVMAECELSFRLGKDLADKKTFSATDVVHAVSDVAPAFELVEDRNAVHRETRAVSLIADNAWNGGIVHGDWRPLAYSPTIRDSEGVLTIDGVEKARGNVEDPFAALAWLANLAKSRNRPLTAGMVVITGSIIPTFELAGHRDVQFSISRLGDCRMRLKW